jgi:acyl carrier protein
MQQHNNESVQPYSTLISLLSQITNTEISSVDRYTMLREMPGLDSLGFIRFVVEVEQAFGLHFEMQELTSNLTLDEMFGIVRARQTRQGDI